MPALRFGREMEGRKLRLHFADGGIDEGVVFTAPAHDNSEGCDGFGYDLCSTNQPDKYEAMHVKIGAALWANFNDVESYEIVEA